MKAMATRFAGAQTPGWQAVDEGCFNSLLNDAIQRPGEPRDRAFDIMQFVQPE